jgi:uncharacterized protein
VALTTVSASFPTRERREAESLAREIGVLHLQVESQELQRDGFAENPPNRCYFCKDELFEICFLVAEERKLPAVVFGATVDDLGDHRPGMISARERGVRAPLLEAGLGKDEIRALSRSLNLRTWNKPAMPCLSSRFPYGTPITAERLGRVERAEDVLLREGFREVRVRFHKDVARLELGEAEWHRLADPGLRQRVATGIREAGFRYVTLDLAGFRSGRLNEGVPRTEEPTLS